MALNETLIYAIPQELVGKFGTLLTLMQALGGVIILYIVFNIINTITNKKKAKELKAINQSLEEIKVLLGKK